MNEDKPTNSINFEPDSSNKDKLLRVDQIVSEADGKVIDRDSVESECEVVTHTSDISTLEELQDIVDRSYQGVLPRNGNAIMCPLPKQLTVLPLSDRVKPIVYLWRNDSARLR